jgi:hypothetical protein
MTAEKPAPTPFTSKFLLKDEEILKLGVAAHDVESYRRNFYRKAFAVPTWCEPLGATATFRTRLIAMEHEEARAVYRSHHGHELSAAQTAALGTLAAKIAKCLADDFATTGAFLKLDTRSPKDVPFDHLGPGDSAELDSLLRASFGALGPARTPNDELIAFAKATARMLRVTDAEKALMLLVKSDRISQDLAKSFEFPDALFDVQVVLREWDDRVPECPGMEFRGFVHNNKLNAVTQYISDCYFADLVAHKEAVSARIRAFFESVVAPRVPHGSYVVDFAILGDAAEDIKVIELNPFYVGAGTGLFSWRVDRELFLQGPFEFRVRESPIPDALDALAPIWRRYIIAQRPPSSPPPSGSCALQ